MSPIVDTANAHPAARLDAQPPVLVHLQLTSEQRWSLARQGSITEERRGPTKRVFKIRFRCEGRVVVRYLTTDPRVAEVARRELAEIQRQTRAARKLRRLVRAARRALRQAKAESAPYLRAMGLRYHGFALRAPRDSGTPDSLPRDDC